MAFNKNQKTKKKQVVMKNTSKIATAQQNVVKAAMRAGFTNNEALVSLFESLSCADKLRGVKRSITVNAPSYQLKPVSTKACCKNTCATKARK